MLNLQTKQTKSEAALHWKRILDYFKAKFTDGEEPGMDVILFLIGVRELGHGEKKFKKDDKLNLMHIAVCRLLEPYGYYRFVGRDQDDWPHFEFLEELPELRENEQTLLMKQAVIQYFLEEGLLN